MNINIDLITPDAPETLEASLEELASCISEFNETVDVSQEGIVNFLKTVIKKRKYTRTLFDKALKESKKSSRELSDFLVENREVLTDKLSSVNMEMEVDYPTGLTSTYTNLTYHIHEIFMHLITENTFNFSGTLIERIVGQLSQNNVNSAMLETGTKKFAVAMHEVKGHYKETESMFDSSKSGMKKASIAHLFVNESGINKAISYCKTVEERYLVVLDDIVRRSELMEKLIVQMVDYVETASTNESITLPTGYVKSLALFIKEVDTMLVILGNTTLRQMATTTNMIYVLKAIVGK